jgi:hypothetical protein
MPKTLTLRIDDETYRSLPFYSRLRPELHFGLILKGLTQRLHKNL